MVSEASPTAFPTRRTSRDEIEQFLWSSFLLSLQQQLFALCGLLTEAPQQPEKSNNFKHSASPKGLASRCLTGR